MSEKGEEKFKFESRPLRPLDKRRIILSKVKRKVLKHIWFLRGVVLGGILTFLYLLFVVISGLVKGSSLGAYFGLARSFVFTPQEEVKLFNNRSNILILGKGGEGHEAPDLTDTIIFASVNHEKPSVNLISLPRDIWIPELRTKLNSTYYWGNKKKQGGGIVLAKATVEEIIGQPVHYGVVVDFSGFKKIIDILGGIEVEVERSFVDEKYPIAGKENDLCDGDPEFKCRYATVKFEKGAQHMDGETSLKFVRSRNAEGDEGTDFARAARQQKVITAIKDKILTKEVLLSPKTLISLKVVLQESVETDIDSSAGVILVRRFLEARENVSSYVSPEDLLFRPPYSAEYDNLYVFIPEGGSWENVHKWVDCVISKRGGC